MKAAVRCAALTMAALRAQEKHGKRQDASSRNRKVRDAAPIVAGGLDLADLLAAHTEGTKKNAAAGKVALHFIIRFPPEVLTDDAPGPYQGKSKEQRQRLMARQAVKFINEAHGGRAVFAVRVDRDEAGESIVDVFACPKYTKTTKKGEAEWTSLTKFGKALAVKHQDEVRRRSKDYEGAAPITSPRAVGMALQSEFAAFFQRENGVALSRTLKEKAGPDRLGVEEFKAARDAWDEAEAAAVARKEEADAAAVRVRQKAAAHLATTLALAEELNQGTIYEDESGKVLAANPAALRPGLPDLAQAVKASAAAGEARRRAAEIERAAKADREAAAAELKEARGMLAALRAAYDAVRESLPRIRGVLTAAFSTEEERARARVKRREVVGLSPMLRRVIRDNEERLAAEEPVEETPAVLDIPGL